MHKTLRTNIRYTIGAALFGVICLWFAVYFYNRVDTNYAEMITLSGTLSENLKIDSRRNSKSLVIKLVEYPGFQFRIGSMSLKGTASDDLKQDLQKGHQIDVGIAKTDFEKKITREIPLSFWESYWNFERIRVIEASTDEFDYLTLRDYNRVHRKNALWGICIFGFFGLLFLSAATLFFVKRHEESFEQKPKKSMKHQTKS